jgi:hypothetical protein
MAACRSCSKITDCLEPPRRCKRLAASPAEDASSARIDRVAVGHGAKQRLGMLRRQAADANAGVDVRRYGQKRKKLSSFNDLVYSKDDRFPYLGPILASIISFLAVTFNGWYARSTVVCRTAPIRMPGRAPSTRKWEVNRPEARAQPTRPPGGVA